MLDTLKRIADTYETLQEQMYQPEVASDIAESKRINMELSSLKDAYELYKKMKVAHDQEVEARELLELWDDDEIIELAKSQLDEATSLMESYTQEAKIVLLPKDPNDQRNIYLEIRQAAGGDEAWLFASELLRMYLRYAEVQWWKPEIIEHESSGIGGLKFAMLKIKWESVFSKMKFESGVHRVQRIPDTESQWRIHTSTITVAVMPEVDDVAVDLDTNDVEMDTFAASSSWGQHANKNQTWVRLHHRPTGIIVMWTDSKSQLQNKENAWKMLKAKLFQLEIDKQIKEQKDKRFDQIGTWDRSEKIRTYNYPQDRVTDHRIKQSWSNIPWILDGQIDDIVNAVVVENQAKLLEQAGTLQK